jgi:hypothetical protein
MAGEGGADRQAGERIELGSRGGGGARARTRGCKTSTLFYLGSGLDVGGAHAHAREDVKRARFSTFARPDRL